MHTVEKNIGVHFKNPELLKQAFIHRSYLNEHRDEGLESNERLEFLGDAVLELSVTKALFEHFPEEPEGTLTSVRSALVRGEMLATCARGIGLGSFLKVSVGEENSGGRSKDYILANAFEALIGALYLDQGFGAADAFIETHILSKLPSVMEENLHIDAKSEFQERAQEYVLITPEYRLLSEAGPDHDKEFVMGVYLKDLKVGEGSGKSKRRAQEEAARQALLTANWPNLKVELGM